MSKNQKQNAHYVDNKKFYQAMIEYHSEVVEAEESGEEKPRISEYIGECFIKIANHLSFKANFVNYAFREEMILDAIDNCVTYAHNFNPEKSKNPFAYFTQIVYYAFIRRIQKEKKLYDLKMKYLQNIDLSDLVDHAEDNPELQQYLETLLQQEETYGDSFKDEEKAETKPRRPKYFDEK